MNALAAEWIKIRTLRSSYWALAMTVVAAGGLSYLVGVSFAHADPATMVFDPMVASFYSLSLAQLAVVVFAVLSVGAEYRGGTIRPSLAAVPDRRAYFLSKVAVVGGCAAVAAALSVAAAFGAAQAGLGPRLSTTLGAPGVPGTVAGAFLYLVLMALFAFGVAQAARSSALALGVMLPILFLGSQGVANVQGAHVVTQYLPDQAGLAILHFWGAPGSPEYDRSFGPWGGVGILALWAAAALAAGYLTLRRRDA